MGKYLTLFNWYVKLIEHLPTRHQLYTVSSNLLGVRRPSHGRAEQFCELWVTSSGIVHVDCLKEGTSYNVG